MEDYQEKDSKLYYKWIPCPDYETECLGSWLEELAAEGFLLDQEGFFAGRGAFKKQDPCVVRYRFVPAKKRISYLGGDAERPDEETEAAFKDQGWEYITFYGQFQIFRSMDENVPELEIQTKEITHWLWKHVRDIVLKIIAFTIYIVIFVKRYPLQELATVWSSVLVTITAVLLWTFINFIREFRSMVKLLKKFRRHETSHHDKPWRKGKRCYLTCKLLYYMLIAVCLLLVCIELAWIARGRNEIDINKYDGTVPFATMKDYIPEGIRTVAQKADFMNWNKNVVQKTKNFFMPVAITWDETVSTKEPNSSFFLPRLTVKYYETIGPWFAHALAKEFMSHTKENSSNAEKEIGDEMMQSLQILADYVYTDQEDTYYVIILQNGNKMIQAELYSVQSVPDLTYDKWIRILTNSLNW